MLNEENYNEWIRYADMDITAVNQLNGDVYPKQLEIICFHCQQAAEKILKALLLANKCKIQKTHNLGLLAQQLIQFYNIPEDVLDGCFYLTQYAVIVRYPHELFVEDTNVSRAVYYMDTICCFAKSELAKIDDCNEAETESKNSNLTNPE